MDDSVKAAGDYVGYWTGVSFDDYHCIWTCGCTLLRCEGIS